MNKIILVESDPPKGAIPPSRPTMILSGPTRSGEGYYGDLIVSRNGIRVHLPVTVQQVEMLREMGIEEYC